MKFIKYLIRKIENDGKLNRKTLNVLKSLLYFESKYIDKTLKNTALNIMLALKDPIKYAAISSLINDLSADDIRKIANPNIIFDQLLEVNLILYLLFLIVKPVFEI